MMDLRANGYVGTPLLPHDPAQTFRGAGPPASPPHAQGPLLRRAAAALLRKSFEDEYSIHTTCAHATAEPGLLGYDCQARTGWHVPESVIVEITDPATGEPLGPGQVGEVTVTAFDLTFPSSASPWATSPPGRPAIAPRTGIVPLGGLAGPRGRRCQGAGYVRPSHATGRGHAAHAARGRLPGCHHPLRRPRRVHPEGGAKRRHALP